VAVIREELAHEGLSVIIARRACVTYAKEIKHAAGGEGAGKRASQARRARGCGMNYDLVICGVGGQGVLSIAWVIDHAAHEAGLHFKQSEVHGMAQRGGAVSAFVRLSDRRWPAT
jgi:indolepyruvate ferredoxin oxidoreductase alpha subunit